MDAGLEDILDGYFPFWGCIHKASFRFSPRRLGEYLDCILWFLSFKGWDHVCIRTVTQRSVLFGSEVALSKFSNTSWQASFLALVKTWMKQRLSQLCGPNEFTTCVPQHVFLYSHRFWEIKLFKYQTTFPIFTLLSEKPPS